MSERRSGTVLEFMVITSDGICCLTLFCEQVLMVSLHAGSIVLKAREPKATVELAGKLLPNHLPNFAHAHLQSAHDVASQVQSQIGCKVLKVLHI